MKKLNASTQEALVALLCFDEAGAKSVAALVPPRYFDPFYRQVAEEAGSYLTQWGRPPGEHTLDIIESLKERKPDEKDIYDRIYRSLLITRNGINREYVLQQAGYFMRRQQMKAAIQKALPLLNRDDESAVDEAEALLGGVGKTSMDLVSPGTLLNDPNQALRFLDKADDETMPTGIKELDNLKLGPSRKQLWMMAASANKGKSVSLYSRIWTLDHGYVYMRDLLNQESATVLGVNRHSQQVQPTLVEARFPSGQKKTAFIHLRSGRILQGFADSHPVLTPDGYVRADNLQAGDCVVGSSVLPLQGSSSPQQVRECYALGAFIGNGSMTGVIPRLCLHQDDEYIAHEVGSIIGLPPRILRFPSSKGINACYSYKIRLFFDRYQLGKTLSKDKSVPRVVYSLGREAVASCLAGLFDADGSVYAIGSGGWSRVELSTASYDLSEDYLTMLNVLGIYATRHTKHISCGGKYFEAWSVIINNDEALSLFCESVLPYSINKKKRGRLKVRRRPSGRQERGQFFKGLPTPFLRRVCENLKGADSRSERSLAGACRYAGLSSNLTSKAHNRTRTQPSQMEKLAEYIGDEELKSWCGGQFVFDEVESVEWGPPEPCWDLQTEADHQSFLCEHVITHNSFMAVQLGKMGLVHGRKVLHITLEMSEEEVCARYCQSLFAVSRRASAEIIARKFKCDEEGHFIGIDEVVLKDRPALDDPNIRPWLEKRLKPLSNRPRLLIKQFPTGQLTIKALNAYLDRLEASLSLTVDEIVLDYPDLMQIDVKNYRHAIDEIYKGLRGIAVERNLAMAIFSQSNKSSMSAKVSGLDKLSEDVRKAATTDTVLSYNQTPAEYELGLARLFVAKARNEAKHFQVLIAQTYALGQFALHSVMMKAATYWPLVEETEEEESKVEAG